ncbi:hypothetical protein TELCIR_06956 [Teladorsagia circumcincta]|uniref:Reverse transcriptase domain-containing protein n=1 Tax=Teladorsagia circumcincta TaxID=45464 RepID=A0A2G9ULM0_TELCI|nr:hypothetical protein TELCIR_06956 [Teladorsagia circumcincta]
MPDRGRLSLVTPIPIRMPHSSPSNYRPKRIVMHLDEYNTISDDQHGFQKGKSTVTAMLQSLNDWTSYIDSGMGLDVVYLDFEKAFDKVSHHKLISKLIMVGIHPRIIAWIEAFLANRTFAVRVKTVFSEPKPVYRLTPVEYAHDKILQRPHAEAFLI